MSSNGYRFQFDQAIPAAEMEATLVLAIFAVEALHGEAQTRMDAAHAFDAKRRVVVIDAATSVGLDLCRIFVALVSREFGAGSFRVERTQKKPQPEPLTA
jgi:hypothetical protein